MKSHYHTEVAMKLTQGFLVLFTLEVLHSPALGQEQARLIGVSPLIRNTLDAAERGTLDSSKKDLFWVNVGLGIGSSGGAAGANFSYHFGSTLVSLRYVYGEEIRGMFEGPSPLESVWDLGLLYGVSEKASYGVVSVSAGVGLVGGVRRGRYLGSSGWWFSHDTYEKVSFSTLGVPMEGQLFWTPSSHLGVGVYAFANLNRERSFIGALLCVQIGALQ